VEKRGEKTSSTEIVDYIKYMFQRTEGMGGAEVVTKSESNKSVNWQMSGDGPGVACASGSTLASSTNVHFLPMETKLLTIMKKRYLNQIISLLSSAFSGTSGNCTIEVMALELSYKIVRSVASECEFSEDPTEMRRYREASISCLTEKHQRFRKYLSEVLYMVYDIKSEKKSALITLFSYTDMKFVILS
jgi:hypothetical protein